MLQIIGAALGLVSGANNNANQQYLQGRDTYAATLAFDREKDLTWYTAYKSSALWLGAIAAIGVIGLVIFILILNRKSSK